MNTCSIRRTGTTWAAARPMPPAMTSAMARSTMRPASPRWRRLPEANAKARAGPARRSQVFLAVTLEESGLLGSKWYATNPVYPLYRSDHFSLAKQGVPMIYFDSGEDLVARRHSKPGGRQRRTIPSTATTSRRMNIAQTGTGTARWRI
jgi:hypothetical protein